MPIESATIIETYCALSKQLAEEYRARRTLEWQMHLALWTILAAAIYLCVANHIYLGKSAWWFLAVIPLHFVWTIKIVTGQVLEQRLSIYYRKCAVSLLQVSAPAPDSALPPSAEEESSSMPDGLVRFFRPYLWWLFVQMGTTTLFCSFAIVLTSDASITTPPTKDPTKRCSKRLAVRPLTSMKIHPQLATTRRLASRR
jgi:hypothetical protein